MGTSGSGNQFFHHHGRRYGHIVDPRSGRPAEKVLSATVLAPTATLADALATAFFVMGKEEAFEFCRRNPQLALILVCPGEKTDSIAMETIGLPDHVWHPAKLQ